MKQKRSIFRALILGIIAIALGATVYGFKQKNAARIEMNQAAPDFVLTSLEGEKIQLSRLKGKGVLLNFWATWCEPCKREMPLMEKEYQVFKEHGVEFLAVNIAESHIAVSAFVNKLNLSFPILLDKDRIITNLYEVGPLPSTFFINKDGMVVAHFIGEMNEITIRKHLSLIIP